MSKESKHTRQFSEVNIYCEEEYDITISRDSDGFYTIKQGDDASVCITDDAGILNLIEGLRALLNNRVIK